MEFHYVEGEMYLCLKCMLTAADTKQLGYK